ncbi:MAG: hypothetical protein U0575_11780 [Phycisphaerales bacterium]
MSASIDESSTRALTWASLLARWMEFARAAVALPRDADGDRWRAAVPAIIELHATTMALKEAAQLARDERALARDRAALIVHAANARLGELWRGAAPPVALLELQKDAAAALASAAWLGARELAWLGPGELVVPPLAGCDPEADGFDQRGTLVVAPPGTILMPGEPIAWWVDRDDLRLDAGPSTEVRDVAVPRQVHRVIGADGRAAEDLVVAITDEAPAGTPLLETLCEDGRRVCRARIDAKAIERRQRAAMPAGLPPGGLPVRSPGR